MYKSKYKIITIDRPKDITYALIEEVGAVQPFIVAVHYNSRTNQWGYGKYFSDKASALKYYATCIK